MRVFPTFVLIGSVSMASRGVFPQDKAPLFTHSIHNPTVRFALVRAAKEALERLERPECRKVLSDFRDASGRTIQENLDLLGETPRSYLARITFREGLDSRRCRDVGILAFTSIGGREVFICGQQFWQVYRSNPTRVEAVLIHEMLHTLGLGENPPSSTEINTRVLKRCWLSKLEECRRPHHDAQEGFETPPGRQEREAEATRPFHHEEPRSLLSRS